MTRMMLTGVGRNVAAIAASLAIKDLKVDGTGNNLNDPNLSTMGLNFAAGDLLVGYAALHHYGSTGTSAQITEGTHTGWNTARFFNTAASEDADGLGVFWKIAAGGETTVDFLNGAGAAGTITDRHAYVVCSYSISGTPSIVGTPNAFLSGTAPTLQTVSCGSETDLPVLVFSWAIGNADPTQNFNGATPDQDSGVVGASGLFARLKTKIFTASPVNITTDFPADTGPFNGLISGYFQMVP